MLLVSTDLWLKNPDHLYQNPNNITTSYRVILCCRMGPEHKLLLFVLESSGFSKVVDTVHVGKVLFILDSAMRRTKVFETSR